MKILKNLYYTAVAISFIFLMSRCTLEQLHNNVAPKFTFEKVLSEQEGGLSMSGISQKSNGAYALGGIDSRFTYTRFSLIDVDSLGIYRGDTRTFDDLKTDEYLNAMKPTSDGGFIFCGYKKIEPDNLFASNKMLVIAKFSSSGFVSWMYYDKTAAYSEGEDIIEMSDGSFVAVGFWNNADFKQYAVKVSAEGNRLWHKTYSNGFFSILKEGNNGNIVAVDFENNIQEINPSNGNLVDTRALGDLGFFSYRDAQFTSDGGFIVLWSSGGCYEDEPHLSKYDANGNQEWSEEYYTSSECLSAVKETPDGGFVVCGTTLSLGAGGRDMFTMKVNSNGNEQWMNTFGGALDESGVNVTPTRDGGYLFLGYDKSISVDDVHAGDIGIYLVKTDQNGQLN